MELFAQQVLNGLVTGSVYSLVALGLTLIYGTMQVPNFAHGQLFMLGAYFAYALVTSAGLPYWPALALSVLAVSAIGVLLERLVFRPLSKAAHLNSMIAALGLMLFLEAVAQNIWGPEFLHMDSPYGGVVSLFGLLVTTHRLVLLGAAVVLMVVLLLFLTRTTEGSAIRATAQNSEGALLVGIDTNRVAMTTFAISAGLAAFAGALIAPISLVYPSMGAMITLKGFVIVVLGGMGSVPGALIGGYLLALAESLGGTYVSSTYQDLVAFVVLSLVFAVKPSGLFKEAVSWGVVSRFAPSVALAIAVVLPLVVPNEYYLQILTQAYVFAIAACGLNVIVGFAGQLSLAHAGFFGIGAYAVALLATKAGISFWLGLPAGIALCAASGFVVGSICLRSKGHYFAIFTLAVGIIIHLVIQKWESLTHGHVGVIGIPGPGPLGPIHFDSSVSRSYLALFFLGLTVFAVSRLLRSPVGRTLMAVRESEALAAAVGLDVMAAKRLAFTMSAALAGLAGGLFAGFIGFLGPESSNVEMTFNMLLYVMVGGIGSLSGPVAGTFIVYGLSQLLAVLQQYQMVIFGLALVLLILFMPTGLAGVWRSAFAAAEPKAGK